MDPSQLNYLAVVAAALSTFAIGGLWYSPILFGKTWMAESAITEEMVKSANMLKIFGGAFILSFIMAFNLAMFLGDSTDVVWGMTAGFLAGFGWVALGMGVICLFEQKSLKYWLINGGYWSVSFVVMGAILAAWK